MNITPNKEHVNDTINELIDYAKTSKDKNAKEFLISINDKQYFKKVELLVTKLLYAFGVCAFSLECNDLEEKNDLIELIDNNEVFIWIKNTYLENITLDKLNPLLNHDKDLLYSSTKRLKDWL